MMEQGAIEKCLEVDTPGHQSLSSQPAVILSGFRCGPNSGTVLPYANKCIYFAVDRFYRNFQWFCCTDACRNLSGKPFSQYIHGLFLELASMAEGKRYIGTLMDEAELEWNEKYFSDSGAGPSSLIENKRYIYSLGPGSTMEQVLSNWVDRLAELAFK